MKTSNLSKLLKLFFLLLIIAATSSCNRGYGCPTNFSLDVLDIARSVVSWLL